MHDIFSSFPLKKYLYLVTSLQQSLNNLVTFCIFCHNFRSRTTIFNSNQAERNIDLMQLLDYHAAKDEAMVDPGGFLISWWWKWKTSKTYSWSHEGFEWLSRLFAENMDSSKGGKSPASYGTAGSWEQGPAQSALFGHLHCAFVSFFRLFFWAKPCYSSQSSKIYTFEIRHFLLGNGNVGYIFSLRSHPIRVPIDTDCIRWPSVDVVAAVCEMMSCAGSQKVPWISQLPRWETQGLPVLQVNFSATWHDLTTKEVRWFLRGEFLIIDPDRY